MNIAKIADIADFFATKQIKSMNIAKIADIADRSAFQIKSMNIAKIADIADRGGPAP
jgi:hypothetical protein